MGRSIVNIVLGPGFLDLIGELFPNVPPGQVGRLLIEADAQHAGECTYFFPPADVIGRRLSISVPDDVYPAAERRRGPTRWGPYVAGLLMAEVGRRGTGAVPPVSPATTQPVPPPQPVEAGLPFTPAAPPHPAGREHAPRPPRVAPASEEPAPQGVKWLSSFPPPLGPRPSTAMPHPPVPQPQPPRVRPPPPRMNGVAERLRRAASSAIDSTPEHSNTQEATMNTPTQIPATAPPSVKRTRMTFGGVPELALWTARMIDGAGAVNVQGVGTLDEVTLDEVHATLLPMKRGDAGLFLLGRDQQGDGHGWMQVEVLLGIDRIAAICEGIGGNWQIDTVLYDAADEEDDDEPESDDAVEDAPEDETDEDSEDDGDSDDDGDPSDDDDDGDDDSEDEGDESDEDDDESVETETEPVAFEAPAVPLHVALVTVRKLGARP